MHINTRLQHDVYEHPVLSITMTCLAYNPFMQKHKNELPPELERYLALCKRTYERMERDGTWPWNRQADSTLSEDLVESESDKNKPKNI